MTQGKGETTPRYCPRCGGLMRKPAGSTLYWHADNNHPRCQITNIVESALEIPVPEPVEPTPEKPQKRRNK